MLKFIDQKILRIDSATGAEIVITPDDGFVINTFTNHTEKNTIRYKTSSGNITSLEGLPSKIDRAIPLSVVFNGKGILTKNIPPIYQKDNPLASILPGANPADFYYEIYQSPAVTVISVIRKQVADNILTNLTELGFKLISVSVGFTAIAPILQYLKHPETNEINTGSFTIITNQESQIVDFKINNENSLTGQTEHLIAEQYVKAQQLLSFAASVNLMTESLSELPSIQSKVLIERRKEYKYYRYFRFSGISLLIMFFIILLTNFLFYSHYFNLNQQLQNAQPLNDQQNEKVRKTEMDIRQKEKFLTQSGWITSSRTSYYADRIASLTPSELLLTSMNLFPLKNDNTGGTTSAGYKKDLIEVAGICYDPVVLNQFVNGLKIIPDFKKITVKNYQYRKESEAGAFLMEIITK